MQVPSKGMQVQLILLRDRLRKQEELAQLREREAQQRQKHEEQMKEMRRCIEFILN